MTTLVVAHDAGGAEILSSWALRQNPQMDLRFLLSGPAREIFNRKFSARSLLLRFPLGPDMPKFVLCGSGLSGVELELIEKAHEKNVYSAVWLDHWKNYHDRFVNDRGRWIPDEVWVTDRHAARLAERELPRANVIVRGNPYANEVVAETRSLERASGPLERVVYISEPRRRAPDRTTLEGLMSRPYCYRPRPHPSESPAVRSLAEDLAWADVVVGYDSMALAIALRTGRRVVSLLPADEKLHIPWTGIERLYA